MPASYQNLKNPGIQADFVIRHRQDSSGNIVMADGMEAEFELASAKRLTLIPVAYTGSTATALRKRELDRFADYYPAGGYKRLFQDLEKMGTAQQVAKRVVALIERLRDRRA